MPVTSLSTVAHNEVLRAMDNHALPNEFYRVVEDYYVPIARVLAASAGDQTRVIGIQGSQGSGKSTCADFLKLLLECEHKLRTVVMSIDDFYLTRAERESLARERHPLFSTRGVPGTHDTDLIQSVFNSVKATEPFVIPAFDKSRDNRAPESEWQQIDGHVDVLILEGWCVGVTPQTDSELELAINELESNEDPEAVWRTAVNDALKEGYAEIFSQLDSLICLQAPSFDCVYGWRLLQEQKMIARLQRAGEDIARAQTPEQIDRFIAHYQRLTQRALDTMPSRADILLTLNADHSFDALKINQ